MQKFVSIESLRAWAAWWVVLGHALHLGGIRPGMYDGLIREIVTYAERGWSAVNVFIIVSGFVITHLYLSKREGYMTYIVRRWFRLFPIFLFCLALAIIIKPLYVEAYLESAWPYARESRMERALEEKENFLAHLLLHLSLLHGLIPNELLPFATGTFLAPAWSLSLEWQFYVLAPFILVVLFRYRILAPALVAFSLWLSWFVRDQSALSWEHPALLAFAMPHFLLGISSRFALEAKGLPLAYWAAIFVASSVFADNLALLIWVFFYIVVLHEKEVISMPAPVLRVFNVVALNRYISNIGKWSYSTYLIHIPMFSIFVGGLDLLMFGGDMSQPQAIFAVTFAALLTLPVSWILYEIVEKPFTRIGAKVAARLAAKQSFVWSKAGRP